MFHTLEMIYIEVRVVRTERMMKVMKEYVADVLSKGKLMNFAVVEAEMKHHKKAWSPGEKGEDKVTRIF